MLPVERHSRIVASLDATHTLTTEELAERLGVSMETVRRDLTELDRQGRIRRVRGGAMRAIQPSVEPHYQSRLRTDIDAKRAIGRRAADLIPDGAVTFIDVGTTTLQVAEALAHDVTGTVMTTSLPVAAELSSRPGLEVIIAGGYLRAGDGACSGRLTESYLASINPDFAVVGSGGIDVRHGLTDFHEREVDYRRVAIDRAAYTIALGIAAKIGIHAPYTVCPLDSLNAIVTNSPVEQAFADAAGERGIDLQIATVS